MDLKFTFASNSADSAHPDEAADSQLKPLPFQVAPVDSSSELLIEVFQEADHLVAIAKSPGGAEYARQQRQLSRGSDGAADAASIPALAYRSVLARAVAELGDKLTTAITELRLPAAALPELLDAGLITQDYTTAAELTLRTGIAQGTPVTAL